MDAGLLLGHLELCCGAARDLAHKVDERRVARRRVEGEVVPWRDLRPVGADEVGGEGNLAEGLLGRAAHVWRERQPSELLRVGVVLWGDSGSAGGPEGRDRRAPGEAWSQLSGEARAESS